MAVNSEIWITGLGTLSAIGRNTMECLSSLRADASGIHDIRYLSTIHSKDFVAGEIPIDNKELTSLAGISDNIPRTVLLGAIAAKEAISDAGISGIADMKTGIIVGTTVGGMDKTEILYRKGADPSEYIHSHHCGFTTRYIAQLLGPFAYVNTISTACSSGANAIMLGARLIKHGILDAVLAGGTDALSGFTLNGFRSLMILDPKPCRPYTASRKGLNLGEGAGFIYMESAASAIKRQAKAYARIRGYGNCNDAFHQTASSPDGRGAYRAMYEALKTAGIDPSEIDYINVHGTGTDNNDLTESIAIKKLFGDNIPDLSSTKSFTGHCLGAAGAIEAVYSILAISHGEVYANLRFDSAIEETGLIPVSGYKQKKVDHVLSNSFGFGGCDTSLLFSGIRR